jgi:hypothetical protein
VPALSDSVPRSPLRAKGRWPPDASEALLDSDAPLADALVDTLPVLRGSVSDADGGSAEAESVSVWVTIEPDAACDGDTDDEAAAVGVGLALALLAAHDCDGLTEPWPVTVAVALALWWFVLCVADGVSTELAVFAGLEALPSDRDRDLLGLSVTEAEGDTLPRDTLSVPAIPTDRWARVLEGDAVRDAPDNVCVWLRDADTPPRLHDPAVGDRETDAVSVARSVRLSDGRAQLFDGDGALPVGDADALVSTAADAVKKGRERLALAVRAPGDALDDPEADCDP